MLRLFLMRHGQTPCSVADVLCGQCPVSLDAAGERMAADFASAYGRHRWTAMYSSPLPRALQTIAPTARAANLDVTPLPGLAEINFGDWDGAPSSQLATRNPEFRRWLARPDEHACPRGESGRRVLQRALAALDHIRTQQPQGDVLVMTHKTTLRVLLCHFTGEDLRHYRQRFPQPLGAINVVDVAPTGFHLRRSGDISYQPCSLLNT